MDNLKDALNSAKQKMIQNSYKRVLSAKEQEMFDIWFGTKKSDNILDTLMSMKEKVDDSVDKQ